MNSMLEDVLAREGSAPAFEDSRVDAELEEMLSKMRTKHQDHRLGGGGCNTIARVYARDRRGGAVRVQHGRAAPASHHVSPRKSCWTRITKASVPARCRKSARRPPAKRKRNSGRSSRSGYRLVTCGLGGGTGTGSCGYVARLAKEMGAPHDRGGHVTLPRGRQARMESADGASRGCDAADTVITIPNDKLLDLVRGSR